MKYSKRVRSFVSGKLLRAFDEFCAKKIINESDGVRDCIDIWIRYIEESRMIRSTIDKINVMSVDKTDTGRQLRAYLHGKSLTKFELIYKNRLMSEAEAVREAIRIATNFGRNTN